MTKALRALAIDPFGRGTKPLTNLAGERAMRVGGWRIIYSVDESSPEVHVDSIGPRGQVYRDL
jgi:mRNA interferase RelE/StbE